MTDSANNSTMESIAAAVTGSTTTSTTSTTTLHDEDDDKTSNRTASKRSEQRNNSLRRPSALLSSLRKRLSSSKHQAMTMPDLERNNTSLSSIDDEEQTQLEEMIQQLSSKEMEIAARSSYDYLIGTSTEKQAFHAQEFCLRYLRSKKNIDKALSKVKETLEFRQKVNVDEIRTAFDNKLVSSSSSSSSSSPTSETATTPINLEFQETLRKNLASKKLYVQGYDREGRSTFIFIPRNVNHHDPEWTIKEHVYTLERALACSKATDKTVNAVVDFTGFSSSKHAPPMHIGKEFMTILRNCYVGAIHQIFIVNAPSAFYFLWSVLKHFVGKNTREKIHFVNGGKKKKDDNNNLLSDYYNVDQAASWMMPGGTKNRELNVDEYLLETPFDQAFDEDPPHNQ